MELNLPLRRSGAKVFDINSRVSSRFTLIEKFGFGHLERDKAALLVWPELARPWAGILAQDMLQPYDIDVDFADDELKMYARDCLAPARLDARCQQNPHAEQRLASPHSAGSGRQDL